MKNINEIKKHLKPFDVLCYYKPDIWPPRKGWFKRFGYWMFSKPITIEAKAFFGNKADWKIFHVELFLGDVNNLVIEPPKIHWGNVDATKYENFSIFRLSNFEFIAEDREFAINYLEKNSAYYRDNGNEYKMRFINSLYNLGDLGNFLVNDITGSVLEQKHKPFSLSNKDTVCSIGIASFFEAFRVHLQKSGRDSFNELFKTINLEKFKESNPKLLDKIEEDYAKYHTISVEAVRPAFFGNSEFFNNEFKFVKSFK